MAYFELVSGAQNPLKKNGLSRKVIREADTEKPYE
jgi:hypothetical protein